MRGGRSSGETSAVQAGRERRAEIPDVQTEKRVRAGVATPTASRLTPNRRERPATETRRARTANRHR
jgi:hypothetical protein